MIKDLLEYYPAAPVPVSGAVRDPGLYDRGKGFRSKAPRNSVEEVVAKLNNDPAIPQGRFRGGSSEKIPASRAYPMVVTATAPTTIGVDPNNVKFRDPRFNL
jgi:hypothetical protein